MNDLATIQLLLTIVAGSIPMSLLLLTIMLYLDRKQSNRMDSINTDIKVINTDIKVINTDIKELTAQQREAQGNLDYIVYGNDLPAPVARRRARAPQENVEDPGD